MKKTESKLWLMLRQGTTDMNVHWSRIESWSLPGIPDLIGCCDGMEFWVELKVLTTKSDKKFPKWRPHQIAWQTQRSSVGGIVWNLVHHPSSNRLYLLDGKHLAKRLIDDDHGWDAEFECPSVMDRDGWMDILVHMLHHSSSVVRRKSSPRVIMSQCESHPREN